MIIFKKTLIAASIGLVLTISGCGGSGSSDNGGLLTDTTPPVITLTGDNPQIVTLNSTYSDPGAKANDNIDGEFAATASGSVETSKTGKYTITYTAKDEAGNKATEVTRTVKVTPPSVAGSSKYQVKNGRLEMHSVASKAAYHSEGLYFGRSEANGPNANFVSIEGDLSLISSQITNKARARVYVYLRAVSLSSNEFVNFFLAIENRKAGIMSRAYMTTSAGIHEIPVIHNKPLKNGKSVKFKIELLDSDTDFAKLTIGDTTVIIEISEIPASDMTFVQGYFGTHVKEAEKGDFVKSSVDYAVIKMKSNSETKTYIESFDAYKDGTAPIGNKTFNLVSFPESVFTKRLLTKNPWYTVAADGDCHAKFVYNNDGTARAFFKDDNGLNTAEDFTYTINSGGNLVTTQRNGNTTRYVYTSGNTINYKHTSHDSDGATELTSFKFYGDALRDAKDKGNNNCGKYLSK